MATKQKITLIAAIANNRVLGANNQLLWHLPADFKHFKKATLGKPIIMGRKTFDSIGKGLPGRHNIIITRNSDFQAVDCTVVHSLEEALAVVIDAPEVMIVGGATIYQQALACADTMILTFVEGYFEGDTFFPEWDPNEWQQTHTESHPADDKNPYSYTFMTLIRV